MHIVPMISLAFAGRCEEAFRFYEQTLGGKITFSMTWGGSPMAKDAPPEWADKILHTSMDLGGVTIVGGDFPPPTTVEPQGFGVVLNMNDVADAEKVFAALSEGGTVTMPLSETFWARRYGGVTDRFGIPWEINCGQPEAAAQ